MPEDTNKSNGRRWYDPNKMVWGMIAVIGSLASFIFLAAYMILSNGIDENRADIKKVSEVIVEQRTMQKSIDDRLRRIEYKLDSTHD